MTNELHREGYLLFFIPGSCGRLIGNIVYKLISNDLTKIELTEYNSAHNSIDSANFHFAMNKDRLLEMAADSFEKNNMPIVINHLSFDEGLVNFSKTTNKNIISIKLNDENLSEVSLNAVIKNVFPRLLQVLNNKPLSEREQWVVDIHTQQYLNLAGKKLEPEILVDPQKMQEYLEFIVSEPRVNIFRNHYRNFIEDTFPKNKKMFQVSYNNMFERNSNGKYSTLVELANWLNVKYNDDVHNLYDVYIKGQNYVFEKYCPWFVRENKHD